MNPDENMPNKCKDIASYSLVPIAALISGGLYFFVAAEGAHNLGDAFNKWGLSVSNSTMEQLGKVLGVGASLCFTAFSYKVFSNLTLKPHSSLSWILSILSPFAASSFFIAGLDGSQYMGINNGLAVIIGLVLFVSRTVSMIDSSVKFPEKINELLNKLVNAIETKNWKNLTRLMVTFLTSAGFSLAATDTIYAAMTSILQGIGATPNKGVEVACYISGVLGAIGLFPLTLYWTYRGVNQLTYGGEPDENNINPDLSDRYTVAATLATAPVILGSLGTVSAAGGEMFSKTGSAAVVIRVVSSVLFAVAGGVPGFSTMFRAMPEKLKTCSESISNISSRIYNKFFKPAPSNLEELNLLADEAAHIRYDGNP